MYVEKNGRRRIQKTKVCKAKFLGTLSVMKLLVITASTNEPSNSAALATAFAEGAHEACTCDIETLHLTDFPLQQFTIDCYDDRCEFPKEYLELRKMIQWADGVVIATPVWNFGVPAHLKNCIDWMGCFGLDTETHTKGQLQGKPFYFIFTGGAPKAAWKGLMRFTTMFVRESIRYFGGTVAGKFYEGHCTAGKGKFGLVVDKRPETLAAIRKQGVWFARFIENFMNRGKLPLKYRIIEWGYKKGQRLIAKF